MEKTVKLPTGLHKWAAIIVDYDDRRDSDDGVWVHLAPGWRCSLTETHSVTEDTLAEVISGMDFVEPCTCSDCR
jgi:hypothetical protein